MPGDEESALLIKAVAIFMRSTMPSCTQKCWLLAFRSTRRRGEGHRSPLEYTTTTLSHLYETHPYCLEAQWFQEEARVYQLGKVTGDRIYLSGHGESSIQAGCRVPEGLLEGHSCSYPESLTHVVSEPNATIGSPSCTFIESYLVCHRDITGRQVDSVYISPGEKFLYHQKRLFPFFSFAMLRQHG